MTKYAPDEVARYIADQPERNRAELTRITKLLADALGTEPAISYQIIGFRAEKKFVIYLSGWADHLSLYGQSVPLGQEFAARYPEHFTLKGTTLHFQPSPPLPDAIILELLARRLELLS
mgnify:CR=1 FL=1